jgi:hypothetical protein
MAVKENKVRKKMPVAKIFFIFYHLLFNPWGKNPPFMKEFTLLMLTEI